MLAAGLVVRAFFCAVVVPALERREGIASFPDRYPELAASLLERGELGFAPPGATPTTIRGPAFPAWLAIGRAVDGAPSWWIGLFASIPGCVAAAALGGVLASSAGPRAGLTGGLLAACHPLSCFVSARALPDEFYGAAVLLGLLACAAALAPGDAGRRWIAAIAAGAFFAATSLTRPIGLILPLIAVVWSIARRPRRLAPALLVGLLTVVPVAAWAQRSSRLAERPVIVEELAGYNFWLGESAWRHGFAPSLAESRRRAHALMAQEAGTTEVTAPDFWYGRLKPVEAGALNRRLVVAAQEAIARHPMTYLARVSAGIAELWFRADSRARTVEYALVALPFLGLGLWGAATSARTRIGPLPPAAPLVAVAAHVLAFAAICPMARYSVSVYPLLAYWAGIAVAGNRSTARTGLASNPVSLSGSAISS